MRLSVLAIYIALCSLLANGCSKGITRATAATVLWLKGKVIFGNAERNDFRLVTLKSRIHDGDSVRLPGDASIDLMLIPAALARVPGDSEIKIDELSITKDGNQTAGGMRDRSARIRLIRGKIIIVFSPSETSASHFAINAGQLTINPDSDCLFSVWTDVKTTRVTCTRGHINASGEAQPSVTIAAGYFQKWPTARIQTTAAANDATAQIDITESLEAGEQLLDQAAALQNRRPF